MSPINIALEFEQEQRVENDRAAVERQIDRDGLMLLKTEAKLDGLRNYPPKEPNSPIYWESYQEGLQIFWINKHKEDESQSWEGVPF